MTAALPAVTRGSTIESSQSSMQCYYYCYYCLSVCLYPRVPKPQQSPCREQFVGDAAYRRRALRGHRRRRVLVFRRRCVLSRHHGRLPVVEFLLLLADALFALRHVVLLGWRQLFVLCFLHLCLSRFVLDEQRQAMHSRQPVLSAIFRTLDLPQDMSTPHRGMLRVALCEYG